MKRVVWICSLVICSIARAQTPPPDPVPAPAPAPAAPDAPAPTPPPEPDPAKVHIDQGAALYNDGNYPAALAEFEEAYRLKPAAYILNNIGLTQKALFRYADAIASLQGYLTGSPNLAPERRAEAEQIIAEMKALLAEVTLTITPDGATVTVDGRPAGTAPLVKPLAIAAGTHSIEITADGYEPQKRDVMVSAGVPLALSLKLKLIPKTAVVRITATAPNAAITIDGKPIGFSPVELELSGGGHTLDVSAAGYQHRHDELVVTAGQRRVVTVLLDKEIEEHRWYQKWYVWTPIVIVVVGVAAGLTLELGTHQSPIDGTLSPGVGNVQ